jgi:hypothetical protein
VSRETNLMRKENPRAILKAVAKRLILAIETEAAPDDPIGLQGLLLEIIRVFQTGLSSQNVSLLSFPP